MSPLIPGSQLDQPTHHDGPKKLDQETLGLGTRAVHVGSEPDPSHRRDYTFHPFEHGVQLEAGRHREK